MLLLRNVPAPKRGTRKPVATSIDKELQVGVGGYRSSGMTKKGKVWFPVTAKRNKNKTQMSNLPLKNKNSILYYTKPRAHILICISKQITDKCWTKFRYNLQFIKCTVCIVQDKVVKVVKLTGPVRLWDFGSGRLFVWEWSCLFHHWSHTRTCAHTNTRNPLWWPSSHHLQNRECKHEIDKTGTSLCGLKSKVSQLFVFFRSS